MYVLATTKLNIVQQKIIYRQVTNSRKYNYRWLCSTGETFCCHDLSPLILSKEGISENQSLTHLFPVMKHLYPDESRVFKR